MKKIAFLVACFCNLSAFAQDGFFLQPETGMGYGNVNLIKNQSDLIYLWSYNAEAPKKAEAYNYQLLAGYQRNNWVLTTGFSMGRSGYIGSYETSDLIYEYISIKQYYNYAMVPLTLGYQFKIGDRFSLTPALGGAVSYNYSSVYSENTSFSIAHTNQTSTKRTLSGGDFDKEYQQTSEWAIAKLNVSYKLSDRIAVVAGPEFRYMLSEFAKNYYDSHDPYYYNGQRNYAYTFNAGVKWNLHATKSK